jgi:hypothetical protein
MLTRGRRRPFFGSTLFQRRKKKDHLVVFLSRTRHPQMKNRILEKSSLSWNRVTGTRRSAVEIIEDTVFSTLRTVRIKPKMADS